MRIIAQKSNTLSTRDFFQNGLTKDFIDAISFNVAYTKDEKIVIFNSDDTSIPITNTINSSNLEELKNYEIILLEEALEALNRNPVKKDLYINLSPTNPNVLGDTNIQEVTRRMTAYILEIKRLIEKFPELIINIHSVNRNLITIAKENISKSKIGFSFVGNDFSFIDVDYYVLISNTQNDLIIDTLLEQKKEVILYIYSDYYISYLYEHYLGEKSTPHLQNVLTQLGLMSNYPEIIHKVFET